MEKIIGSNAQFMGGRAQFKVACRSCINSYSSNILKRGQNPERRKFISTYLKMYFFRAADLAVTTKIFQPRRIYQ